MARHLGGFVTTCIIAGLVFAVSSQTAHSRERADAQRASATVENVVAGVLLVKFKENIDAVSLQEHSTLTGISSVDATLSRFDVKDLDKIVKSTEKLGDWGKRNLDRMYKICFSETHDPLEAAKELSQDPNVEYADPVRIYPLLEIPDDPEWYQQWHLGKVYAVQAWDIVKGDSTVVVAVVDNGVDYQHPDLWDNVWTNEPEANGLQNVDDDGNGFIDDVHGYDLGEGDNNPTNPPPDPDGYFDHGTLLAGVSAAVTNNSLGIAGLSWNCEYMPVKCGKDDSPQYVTAGTEGILYAALTGANVINCSWGGFYPPQQSEQDIINAVAEMGIVVVAAAGNTFTDDVHYPSGYKNVLSVTWVDQNDRRIQYATGDGSTYGLAVDVSAPGLSIFSTVPYNYGGYGRAGGSSLAAPMASGLCCLLVSQHLDWSPLRIMQQVVFTADNIDAMNPGLEGQLGSGRVNAYRAVAEENPVPLPPKIGIETISISESEGDGDGLFERGESLQILGSFRNYSVTEVDNADVILSTDDPSFDLVTTSVPVGDISADTDFQIVTPLELRIREDASGHTARLCLRLDHDGGTVVFDSLTVLIGATPVLVVDDTHDSSENPSVNPADFYTTILDRLDINYGIWHHGTYGTPPQGYLRNFPIVVWVCEWSFPYLTSLDMNRIADFLNNGGHLFVTGQDLAWSLSDNSSSYYSQAGITFIEDYLHAKYSADDSEDQNVVGVPGDPIGDGLGFPIYQPGRASDEQYPEILTPANGGVAVFDYSLGGTGAVRFAGDHRTVYFGFGLEAIDASETTLPNNESPIRTEVMRRTLNWLNPVAHTPVKDSEDTNVPFPTEVTISNLLAEAESVDLLWRKAGETGFNQLPMNAIGGGRFQGEIPAAGDTATIEYYIQIDALYFSWTSPVGAPETLYRFLVAPDRIPPTISHDPVGHIFDAKDSVRILAVVDDNLGVDTTAVFLHYGTKGSGYQTAMSQTANPGVMEGYIEPCAEYGDSVWYFITASDVASAPNKAVSDTFMFLIGYEDFESGLNDWDASIGSWGLDNLWARSGNYSANQSPGDLYPNNYNGSLATNFGFDLSGTDKATLYFWDKHFLEIDHDFGYVEASTDGGASWEQLGESIDGIQVAWSEQSRSLSAFTGPGFDDVRVRFRVQTDATQVPAFRGWYIDDVRIVEGTGVDVEEGENLPDLPRTFALEQNYPNPFNPTTGITFTLPKTSRITLKVYNMLGQRIATLVDKEMPAGRHTVFWNATDDYGARLASGVYFYKMHTPNMSLTRKMVILQ